MFYLLAALTLIIICLAILLYKQYQKIDLLTQILKDNKADPSRWTFADQQLLKQAESKADEIISQAELLAIKTATEKIMESSLFEETLKKKFDESFQQVNTQIQNNITYLQQEVNKSVSSAQSKHDLFLVQLQKQSVNASARLEEEMHSKITGLLLDFEQKLTDFFGEAQQKSLDAINLEIKSARQLIESYKTQQMAIVDENIVAVLERTMNIILKQKLSLKDQVDLVYEGLEKAKLEKFLV